MKRLLLLLTVVLLLTGCSARNSFERYTQMSHSFNSYCNYTIEENNNGRISTYDYANDMVHLSDEENDIYCFIEDGVMYVGVYDSENNIYIKKEEKFDEHYFHPYELSERINKLAGYVNMGELVWKDGAFCGDGFSGSYIYKGESHKPLKIRMEVKDNQLVYLYEEYESNGKKCVDEVRVSNHGINSIVLPLNTIDYSYLEELEKLQEE